MKPAPARQWDFPAAAILVLVLLVAAQRLYATSWTSGLEIPVLLALSGVLLGLGLGASRFRPRAVFWFSLGYSLFLVPLIAAWILYKETPWLERMLSMSGRLGYSLYLFFSGQPVPDAILFIAFASIGFWVIGLTAGHALARRGSFFAAVLPAGVALLIIQLYDSNVGDRAMALAFFAFLSLALYGRNRFVQKQAFWRKERVWVSAEAGTNLNLAILVSALLLVVLAWLAPATGRPVLAVRVLWEDLTRPWQTAQEDLGNAVAGLQGEESKPTTGFYGDTLELGLSAEADDSIYLRVRVPVTARADRYYWRVRTYDQYFDDQWHSIAALDEPYTPTQWSIPLAEGQGLTGEFSFVSPRVNLSLLVTPARPVWTSRPSVMEFLPAGEGLIDPLLFRPDPPILVGEQYIVHARLFNPTELELLAAGEEYPAWVLANYLQLPEDLPPEIAALAQELTAEAVTPYEKATAITEYLRNTLSYSRTVEPPPPGRDPLAWFLFDYKAGYCNYFATAEVLLLRSVGVPARMVVGFAQGEFEQPDRYIVREQDAHAWPEVYFPGLGWVEFEPTGNQPPLRRSSGVDEPGGEPTFVPGVEATPLTPAGQAPLPLDGQETSGSPARRMNSLARLMVIFGTFILFTIVLALAYTSGLLDRWLYQLGGAARTPLPVLAVNAMRQLALTPPGWLARWAYLAGLSPLERAFGVVYRGLRWLHASHRPGRTPAEAARELVQLLPDIRGEVEILLAEYQKGQYSPRKGDPVLAQQKAEVVQRRLQRAAVRMRWDDLRKKLRRLLPGRHLDSSSSSR